jgi:hypothetical protein
MQKLGKDATKSRQQIGEEVTGNQAVGSAGLSNPFRVCLLTSALTGFFLISRCTRRAHAAL